MTLALTVPAPQLVLDPPAAPPALEKPINVRVGALRYPDGTSVLADEARVVGVFLYRSIGAAEELWNEAAKTWTVPPPTVEALAANFTPLGFAPEPPATPVPGPAAPAAPVPPSWAGVVVAAGQKDAGGGDRFVKASGGSPAYRLRAYGSAERHGTKYAGLSAASADLLFVSAAESQRFSVALTPTQQAPDQARLVLKNAALTPVGYVEIRTASPGPQVEIANCDASGNAFATITLASDGSIHLTPGGSGKIVLHGTLHADLIEYLQSGGGGRATL